MIDDAKISDLIATHIRQRHGRIVEVEAEDHLFDDLGLDSLDRVEICLAVEEEFSLKREIREGCILTVRQLSEAAKAIETRSAKTEGLGPKGESAVPQAFAQTVGRD